MTVKVGIIDIGFGNLSSLVKKLTLLHTQPFAIQAPKDLLQAEKIILPGVGHFEKAVQYLAASGLKDALEEAVLVKKVPVLGICLGMQLMGSSSEEGVSNGLGWIHARVRKLQVTDAMKYKVPQAGWNTVSVVNNNPLFRNIENNSEFYFLHAYHMHQVQEQYIAATTTYEGEIVSAIQKNHVFGTQFHPEKSHGAGTQLLKNFLTL